MFYFWLICLLELEDNYTSNSSFSENELVSYLLDSVIINGNYFKYISYQIFKSEFI